MTDDPSRHSDFDNWVKVRDVEAAHKALKGTCPIVYDGRVMTECKNGSSIATGELEGLTDHEQGKHLGIFLFPDDDEFSIKYIRFLHDSTEFLDHSRVLYGDFRFPVVGLDEVIERGVSHAYIKLKTIAGALNWAYLAPEKLLGKPTLYEFIVKNLRFFEHHSLNATEGHRYRNKETLNEALYQKGMFIPPYMNEKKWIQVSLIYAMIKVLELQRDLFLSGREQNLHFLDEIQIPQINRNIVGFYDDIT
jgi:hypothetical protein